MAGRLADFLRMLLALAVPALLIAGRADAAYSVALVAATALILRFAQAPPRADLAFMVLVSLDVTLTVSGVFDHFNHNDTAGHFLLATAVTPVAFHLARRLQVLPTESESAGRSRLAIGAGAALVTIALGTGWELVEWMSDAAFGTDMSLGYTDTVRDLLADTAGAIAGGALVATVFAVGRAGK